VVSSSASVSTQRRCSLYVSRLLRCSPQVLCDDDDVDDDDDDDDDDEVMIMIVIIGFHHGRMIG